MEIRQPAALNRYVDSTIPLTWEVRRRRLALVWPVSFVGGLLLLEQVAFARWVRGESLHSIVPMIPVFLLGVPGGVFLLFELVARLERRQARFRAAFVAVFGDGPRMRLNMAYTGGVLTAVGLGLMFGSRPRPARIPEHDPLGAGS